MNWKYTLLAAFTCLALGSWAQEVKQTVTFADKTTMSFYEVPEGLSKKDVSAAANMMRNYFETIAKNDYEAWMTLLSEKTKERIIPAKFPRKFQRLVQYKIPTWNNKRVMSFQELRIPEAEEGDAPIYQVVLRLPEGKQLPNRVGFDPLVAIDYPTKEDHIGLHLVKRREGFQILIYKLERKGNNQKKNN